MTWRQRLSLPVLLLSLCSCGFTAEGGYGAYWPGFRSYMSGVVPSKSGLYLRNDVVVYSAIAPRVVLNGFPVADVSADVVADIIEPYYVFPWKVLGGNHAFVLTQPFGSLKLSGRIIGTNLRPSGTRFSYADPVISPFLIGWHKGKLHWNTNLAIFIPTGNYDIHRVVNTSRNFWALDPEFAITHYDPDTGWDLSAAVGYTFNFENSATRYTSGNVLHLDYAFGKMLKNGVKPGVLGYIWAQTTPDTGQGALFGSFESRVFGLGPAVQWKTSENSVLMFRYFHEFWARDHLVGDQVALTLKASL